MQRNFNTFEVGVMGGLSCFQYLTLKLDTRRRPTLARRRDSRWREGEM